MSVDSTVSVKRDGADLEITSVVKVPESTLDKLINHVKDCRTDFWLEDLDQTPADWQIRDMVNRLGLRDNDMKTTLIATITQAYRDARPSNGAADDDDDWWESMNNRLMDEFSNLTVDEKAEACTDYIVRNIGQDYAFEDPCCCYGLDELEEKLRDIVMKRLFPDRSMPTIKELEAALVDYIDETPPKQVDISRLQSIVSAVFMGATAATASVGDSPSGWSPK